jgi:hypothetical protein
MRLSDRFIQIGIFSSLALLGMGLGILWLMKQPCPTPKRPRGVPVSAAWIGDCDGGSWVEIVAASAGRYQVRIFHSTYGDREKEGWFTLAPQCKSRDLTPGQLLERVSAYDGVNLIISGEWVGDRCQLVPEPR